MYSLKKKGMKHYLMVFILLLLVEISIAYFHFHDFVRGFLGDVLVIPLLYVLGRLCTHYSGKKVLTGVLVFAFFIELVQLFPIAELIPINNNIFQIIIGNTFDGWDLVAYWLGIIPVLLIEKYKNYGTS